ncbi:hypothetical protein IKF94_02240 [Candidatus Saccharibacteria bacterium]|nr:hypothetical protein [Candidatus Saccharibacteria bacterium]
MEKKIKAYEKFIEKASQEKQTPAELAKLADLHQEMVENFQFERLIHLIITLFFVFISLIILGITAWLLGLNGFSLMTLPMVLVALIITILTCFYVKHYYFLENHIQKLYEYTKKLRNL